MLRTELETNYRIGVIGAGTMGRGIAQVAAQSGFGVVLTDADVAISDQALAFITKMLDRSVEKERMSQRERDEALTRVALASDLKSLSECDLIIEAVAENLELKQKIFSELENICTSETVLVSNTSALPIATIGSQCDARSRIAGMHFMNPVPLMALVEIIYTPLTDPAIVDLLVRVGEKMGKCPVRVKDGPAFLAGNCARALYTEALQLSRENIASPAVVDEIVRDAGGFRMGPFELMDMVGLDVNFPATKSLYEDTYFDARYRPTAEARLLVEAGMLGRKAGRGFYRYDDDGKPIPERGPELPGMDCPTEIWLWGHEASAKARLTELATSAGIKVHSGKNPPEGVLTVVAPLGEDASTVAARLGLQPDSTVAVDVLYGWEKRRTVMGPPGVKAEALAQAIAMLGSDGVPVSVINDSPGFIMPRLQASITNLGCDLCQQEVSSPEELDQAMRLGFNFPEGPLAAGDRLGSGVVLSLVNALYSFYSDDRYRPSPWLKRRGLLDLSLKTLGYRF